MADFILGEGLLAGGLSFLYGLQEAAGSTSAGDVSGVPGRPKLSLVQMGSGGSVEFGADGMTPEGSGVIFAPADVNNGLILTSSEPRAYLAHGAVFAQIAWSGDSGARVMQVGSMPAGLISLDVTPTTVVATLTGPDGTHTLTRSKATNDGAPHFVAVTVSGSVAQLYVDVDGPVSGSVPSLGSATGLTIGGAYYPRSSGVGVSYYWAPATTAKAGKVPIGPGKIVATADPLCVAWVGHTTEALTGERVAQIAQVATGMAERSDQRIARLCRWLHLDADLVAAPGGSQVAYQTAMGGQALDLIAEANIVESGLFFSDGTGRLVQHPRSHRYNARPAAVISTGDIDMTLPQIAMDANAVVNDYEVTRPGGATYRARNLTSIRELDCEITGSATILAASDSDLEAAANHHVARYGTPRPLLSSVTFDLLTASADMAALVLSLQVGDLITITDLPEQTPGGTAMDLFIEGISDPEIAHDRWTVSLSTSPGSLSIVGTLGYTALGSDFAIAY